MGDEEFLTASVWYGVGMLLKFDSNHWQLTVAEISFTNECAEGNIFQAYEPLLIRYVSTFQRNN